MLIMTPKVKSPKTLKARDFRGCWENPIVIHGDLKCSSSQTAQTTASYRQRSVRLCVCMLVCVFERRELL